MPPAGARSRAPWQALSKTKGTAPRRSSGAAARAGLALVRDRNRRQHARRREHPLHVAGEILVRRGRGGAMGDEHQEPALLGEPREAAAHDLAQAAPRPVALDRVPDAALAGDETDARRLA